MKSLGKGFAAALDVASYSAWNFKDKGGIAKKEDAFETAVPDAEERVVLREQAATLLFGGKEGGSFFNKRVGQVAEVREHVSTGGVDKSSRNMDDFYYDGIAPDPADTMG